MCYLLFDSSNLVRILAVVCNIQAKLRKSKRNDEAFPFLRRELNIPVPHSQDVISVLEEARLLFGTTLFAF